jgi:hypothetical protein
LPHISNFLGRNIFNVAMPHLKYCSVGNLKYGNKSEGNTSKLFAEESLTQNCGFSTITFIIQKIRENNTRGFLKTGKDDNLFLNVEAIGKLAD